MDKKAIIKLRNIKMIPMGFSVDVWKGKNVNELAKCFQKRYGREADYYLERIYTDCCLTIHSKKKAELKGRSVVVVVIMIDKPHVIVHELYHALFHLSRLTGAEIKYNAQEWGARMLERLFKKSCQNEKFIEYDNIIKEVKDAVQQTKAIKKSKENVKSDGKKEKESPKA